MMSDTIPSSAGWRHLSGIVGKSRRGRQPRFRTTMRPIFRNRHPLFWYVETRMNDPHPGVFGRSVADGRGFAAELRMLEPRNAAKRRPGRLRLQVSDRDPITHPQPLAQIAVAGALADLIFDDAQDAPQQEMRRVDLRGPARHRL